MNDIYEDVIKNKELVRKYLQDKEYITTEDFSINMNLITDKFNTVKIVREMTKIEQYKWINITVDKSIIYYQVQDSDYQNWKTIILRKYKLNKIINNVKI